MKATELLQQQLIVTNNVFHSIIGGITPEEWVTRIAPGYFLPGFEAWHIVAVQDWVAHVAIRGAGEVRDQMHFAHHPGLNPSSAPTACSLEQADSIARNVSRAEVLEYADAVHRSIVKWLDGVKEKDLYATPDVDLHARRYPPARMTEEFLEEVADMHGWSTARLLFSPCIGHVRAHCGELDMELSLIRGGFGAH